MDKLRSLQYFVAAAEEKSLAGAARRFGVSTQAVAKMITALERGLGVRLFDRASHGLSLTASGAAYRETCLPALSQLQFADELVRATPAQGGVVAGVQHVIAREVLTPALPRFHARHPQIQIDVRDFNRVGKDLTRWRRRLSHARVAAGERPGAAADRIVTHHRGRLTRVLGRARHAPPPQ